MKVIDETETIFDENQNAWLCMLTLDGGAKLELISGPIVENIIKKNITYYHTCYSVVDINKAIKKLKLESRALVISEPKPGKLFNGRLAAFLHTPLGIVELIEKSDENFRHRR